jgi:hypothetical protein
MARASIGDKSSKALMDTHLREVGAISPRNRACVSLIFGLFGKWGIV